MKHLTCMIVACSLLGWAAPPAEQPIPASLIQLLANPEKFDGKRVSVQGYLSMPEHRAKDNYAGPTLFLHREDAEHLLLSNSIWVEPSAEMKRNSKELAGMYVAMGGRFRAGYAGHLFGTVGGITDVEFCNVVSDPNRPITQKYDEGRAPASKPK